jgi:hypothetical protein
MICYESNVVGGRHFYLDLCPGLQNEAYSDCCNQHLCRFKLHFCLLVQLLSQVWCVGHKEKTFILYNTPLNYNSVFHTSKLQ